MPLSYDLVSQFAKQLTSESKKTSSESTVYGTVKVDEYGNKYVKLDGSDQLTPLNADEQPSAESMSVNANDGERVSVLIKNHTATVVGNISSPAARTGDVESLGDQISEIKEFDILIGEKVQANEAYFKKLIGDDATIGKLVAADASILQLIATDAEIEDLLADKITVTDLIASKIDADVVVADKALIESLKSSKIDVLSLLADRADIDKLVAEKATLKKLFADEAALKYANIDFGNITEAAIKKIFSDTGMIKDLVVGTSTITGELVGVTISGDLIKANTLMADKLVVRGSDGNYYKLSTDFSALEGVTPVEEDSIHGSTIVAKSIAAEKIAVDDLVAFGATIGGFQITANSLYSGVKSSVDNTTRGIYLDNDGQTAIGDETNFLKFYYDEETQEYKLEISASSLLFGSSKKNIEEVDSTAQDAQNTANGAQSMADNAIESIATAETTIQQLADSIASLVRDGNGGSLITQDSNGLWYFNIGEIEQSISDTANGLGDLEGIVLNANGEIDVLKSTAAALQSRTEYVRSYTDENGQPCLELGEGDSIFKVRITNTEIQFAEDTAVPAKLNRKMLVIEKAMVKDELQFGDDEVVDGVWIWKRRSNGNLGLMWKEVVS